MTDYRVADGMNHAIMKTEHAISNWTLSTFLDVDRSNVLDK